MKKKYLSIMLVLFMCLALTPAPVASTTATDNQAQTDNPVSTARAEKSTVYTCAYSSNADTSGDGTPENPYNRFLDAVDHVADGGTIYILSTYNGAGVNGFINTLDEYGRVPFVINKNVTIKPAPGQSFAVLVVRASGIVLGGDVTFENIQLSFANRHHDAIFANGHKLTLTNPSLSKGASQLDLFTGELSTNVAYNKPAPGSHGVITLQTNQSFNDGGNATIDFGNIYAGSMNTDFDGTSEIYINDPVGKLKTNGSCIYSCGALESEAGNMFDTALGNEPAPPEANPDVFKTNGNVLIKLNDKIIRNINGTTGSSAISSLEFSNSSPYLISNIMISGISKLNVKSGELKPMEGSSFTGTSAELTVAPGLKFSLLNFPSEIQLNKYNGGTAEKPSTLLLGQGQKIVISESATGKTNVGIGGMLSTGDAAAVPKKGFTYIAVKQPTSDTKNTFSFLDYNEMGHLTPKYDGNGNWIAPSDPSDVTSTTFVTSISAAETKITLPTDNLGTSLLFNATYTSDSTEKSLGRIPLIVLINGKDATPIQDDNGYYSYEHTSSNLLLEAYDDEFYIENLDPDSLTIPAGTYTIHIAVPGKYTSTGKQLSASLTLTVTNETTPETPPADISKANVVIPSSVCYDNGNAIKPIPVVTYENKLLVKGTDYSVTYSNNINPGTATMTIMGIGKYSGKLTKTFGIIINKAGFYQIDGKTYYYNSDGTKKTGLQTIEDNQYYFDEETGARQSGIHRIDGVLYHFTKADGIMSKYKWILSDGKYYFAARAGNLRTGLATIGENQYYFDEETGARQSGIHRIDGVLYHFTKADGIMSKYKWILSDEKHYFAARAGNLRTGLATIGENQYYFDDETGARQSGIHRIDGVLYHFTKADGTMSKYKWILSDGKNYFAAKAGNLRTGLATIAGEQYYFNEETGARQSGIHRIDGVLYHFTKANGTMSKYKWILSDGKKYFAAKAGNLRTGYAGIGGDWYYFDEATGAMQTGEIEVNGEMKYFDEETGKEIK